MKKTQQKTGRYIMYALLCFEFGITMYSCLFGPNGFQKVRLLKDEQAMLVGAIDDLTLETKSLSATITQ